MSTFIPQRKESTWLNVKSGKKRTGFWEYYWPSDRFTVAIKGVPIRHVYGEEPEYDNWRLQR